MENTRETKTFTTTGGHVIEHKTYITGREMNEIQKVLLKNVKVDVKGAGQDVTGFEASSITELNNKTLEVVVVSVDGKKENVIDTLLDLPNSEYAEVIAKINEVTGDKKKE